MATASNSAHSGQHETAVADIPVPQFSPFKTVVQTLLPYYYTVSSPLATSNIIASATTFRLNSVYDCMSTAPQVITAGTGTDSDMAVDTADSIPNQPKLRSYWANIYNFYSVTKCRYKVRVWMSQNDTQGELNVYLYHHDSHNPPVSSSAGQFIPHHYRKYHPGVVWKTIGVDATYPVSSKTTMPNLTMDSAVGNSQLIHPFNSPMPGGTTTTTLTSSAQTLACSGSFYSNTVTFEGDWTPGCIPSIVADDQHQQAWTPKALTPALGQFLTVMVQPSDRARANGSTPQYWFEVELVYETQWRDMSSTLKYPQPDLSFYGNKFWDQYN